MYGSNSLKCQASFKKHKYICIFLQKTATILEVTRLIISIYFTQIHYLADESRTVFNEMVQDKHINRRTQ